jgi:hypothetical protein
MGIDPTGRQHEFMVLRFAPAIDADQQMLVMEALGQHLSRCDGLIGREFFRGEDGCWVEHVTWASKAALEASAGIEEDAVVARLFDCFDTRTLTYACCERVETDRLGAVAEALTS